MNDEVAATFDDLIIRGQTITGIKLVMDTFGCSLQEALIFYNERYRHLCETRPEDFAESPRFPFGRVDGI